MLKATLRGRLKRTAERRVLVGDRVTVRVHSGGEATIERVLPRRSVLRRRSPGQRRGVRAVAANVDQVIVVGAARDPAWDAHLVDRFLAVAGANQLRSVLVVNKCDLAGDVMELTAPYERAAYRVLLTSVTEKRGLAELEALLAGNVSLFTGPTGVGKSSLLNALEPGLRLRTASVSNRSRTGRHTTVAAEMHPLSVEGFVVDTPGLRDVGLWGLEPAEVMSAFPEIAALAPNCRFDDCRHVEEPGCAVTDAVVTGEVAESRLRSYRRLLDEAAQAARPWR